MVVSSKEKHIVAIGGGGWGMEPKNPLLDWYIYKLANKPAPRICFVPSASGDDREYINRFYKQFIPQPNKLSHLSLFKPPSSDLRSFVLEQDIIYVGGGNTKSLLGLWKEWQLDRIFREAWHQGIILCGLSAGSICWFEEGVTDSITGKLTRLKSLGFLPGSNCPHYDGETERRPAYHQLLLEGSIGNGYAADDGVALHFQDTQLHKIVSSRPQAKAYRLEKINGAIEETVLNTEFLGDRQTHKNRWVKWFFRS
jgi:peptidase E